jgi:hypothetical protein
MAELGVDLSNGRWRVSATGELYEMSESFVGQAKVWGQSGEIPLGCLPKIEHGVLGRIAAGTVADSCYQPCYHFLQKAS